MTIKKTTQLPSGASRKKTTGKVTVKKKTPRQAAVEKAAVKKTATKRTAAKKIADRTSVTATVSNEKIQGMIHSGLKAAERARRPVFVDSEIMPADYGSTSITLLARDPHWVHAYWEVSPSSVHDLRKTAGDVVDQCARVIRVYDVSLIEFNGSNANHWFDITVGPEAGNWYINLWSDHITCCADVGLRAPDGTFYTLARSNYVTTPREYISPRHEMIWMDVQPDEGTKPYVYVGREPEPGQSLYDDGKQARRFRMYLTEEEIRAYYSRLFPLLSRILALRKKRKQKRPAAGTPDEDLWDGDGLLLERLEGIEGVEGIGYDYFRELLLGASERMLLRGRKLADILGGASEQLAGIPSRSASEQKPPEAQDFFFELGTELIVYGRTEPDAVVFWGDRMIPLRADGTFTLRMTLPTDTHVPLDFKAVSYHKKEQRTIVTAANREKTEYGN